MSNKINKNITVINGDGIGPEIMSASLRLLKYIDECNSISIDTVSIGNEYYKRGCVDGISETSWKIIKKNPIILKGPTKNPDNKKFKDSHSKLCSELGLFTNVKSFYNWRNYNNKYITIIKDNFSSPYSDIEYVENEDSYIRIMKTARSQIERIARYAFEYANIYQRKLITFTEFFENSIQLINNLSSSIFTEMLERYPNIKLDCSELLSNINDLTKDVFNFDILLSNNLCGNIQASILYSMFNNLKPVQSMSDIGNDYAMFSAAHSVCHEISDQDIANPSGMINAIIDMLVYMDIKDGANLLKNAWLKTLEDSIYTKDMAIDQNYVSTTEFINSIIDRIGKGPRKYMANFSQNISYIGKKKNLANNEISNGVLEKKVTVGFDLFINFNSGNINELADIIIMSKSSNLTLRSIKKGSELIWPNKKKYFPSSFTCRCTVTNSSVGKPVQFEDIAQILNKLNEKGIDISRVHKLYAFDNIPGFSPIY